METIIISLGGSLIVPDNIDVDFLKEFKALILSHVGKDNNQRKKFVIITGGGEINRRYNKVAKELGSPTDEDLDWIGIASLKLNAELLRVIFADVAHNKVVANLGVPFSFEKSIVIGSAYEPGKSTDWDAVLAAKHLKAKKIEKISWADYRAIIPAQWTSRLSSPFDPVASEVAQKEGIQVMIMNGKPIDNLTKCLNGEQFLGTIIS